MRTQVAGQRVREIGERLQLTLKDVEAQSRRLAAARHNPQYLFTAGRLSQIENSNSLPSIYKLATLSAIYHTPYANSSSCSRSTPARTASSSI